MTPKEQRASEILAQYGKTLLPKWEGLKPFWHAWHADSKVYFMKYEEFDGYLDRIRQIEENKPEHERSVQFNLFKPVLNVPDGLNKANDEWDNAHAEWNKACVEWDNANDELNKDCVKWDKARAEWDKAYAEWNKAYKAYTEYRKLFTDELWMQECPEAVLLWSNERNELMFDRK